jgi:hypothetical protein
MSVVYWMARKYMLKQYRCAKKHIVDFFKNENLTIEEVKRECNDYLEAMRAYAFVEFLHYSKDGYLIRDAYTESFTADMIIQDSYMNFVEENQKWTEEKYLKWINTNKVNDL